MKIRQGFISNSSSTSFCIFGSYINIDEIRKVLKVDQPYMEDVDQDDEEIEQLLKEQFDLDYLHNSEDSVAFVGRHIDGMKLNDKTVKDLFKVQHTIQSNFSKSPKFIGGEFTN